MNELDQIQLSLTVDAPVVSPPLKRRIKHFVWRLVYRLQGSFTDEQTDNSVYNNYRRVAGTRGFFSYREGKVWIG